MVKHPEKKIYLKKKFKSTFLRKSLSKRKYGLRGKIAVLRPLFLYLTVKQNNVFFILKKYHKNKIIFKATSEKLKIKVTSKRLRWNLRLLLTSFFFKSNYLLTKRFLAHKGFVVRIVSPIRFRRSIVQFFLHLKSKRFSKLILDVSNTKPYNGCRPSKMIRKKRKHVIVR